jgi:hypothetical protein
MNDPLVAPVEWRDEGIWPAADASATALGKAPMRDDSVPLSPVALGKAPMRDGSVPISPVASRRG